MMGWGVVFGWAIVGVVLLVIFVAVIPDQTDSTLNAKTKERRSCLGCLFFLGTLACWFVGILHFGVVVGFWDLANWIPFAKAALPDPEVPSWLQSASVVGSTSKERSPEQLKAELEAKVKELQAKLTAIQKVSADLRTEKTEIIKDLNDLKITSVSGLKGNVKAQRKAQRLQDIVSEMVVIDKHADDYDAALDQGKAVLRRLERQLVLKQAGISDAELVEVRTTITIFDEKLKGSVSVIQAPLQLEAILRKELGWKD